MKFRFMPAALVAAGLIAAGSFGWSRLRGTGAEETASPYEMVAAKYGPIAQTVSTDGRVEALLVVDVKSKASGVVSDVWVNEADRVEGPDINTDSLSNIFRMPLYVLDPGDLMMELDPVDEQRNVDRMSALLSAEQAKLARAEAELKKIRATVAADRASAKADREAAEADIRPTEAEIKAADAQRRANEQDIRTAMINHREAKDLLERQEKLLKEKLTSQEDYETARAKEERLASELEQAKVNLRVADAKFEQSKSKLKQVEAKINQAIARISLADAGAEQIPIQEQEVRLAAANVSVAQVALAEARRRLDETRIVAPIDGLVLKKYIDKGQVIAGGAGNNASGGDKLLTVADVSRLFVMASVPEADIELVHADPAGPRQKVKISADALGTHTLEGEVVYRVPQATTDNNVTTVKVRIEVTDKDKNRLLPGETCNVEILAAKKKHALVVPAAAVLRGDAPGERFVYILDDAGKPKKAPVEVGISTATLTEITKGLSEGQMVVASAAAVDQPTKKPGASGKAESKQFRPPGIR